ncbi:MAG: class I SAM-dependent methyltransferase [Deltaproteobacteria bacterium]|nr:class I SAM-dependent methyltransferase [Deltaproteobacteria bacterium]
MRDITEPDDLNRRLETISDEALRNLILDVVAKRVRNASPADGLMFLFQLDADLYPLQGELSVSYDGGTHTKHRHTKYHDFFINRINQGERVLDIGCGIGFLAFDIAEKSGAFVTGVDLEVKNIDIANSRFKHPRVKYLLADILTTKFDESFDVAVLSNVLEHLPERPEFLRAMVNAIKPSRILLRVPVFERDWRVPLKEELGIDYRLDQTHYTEYTLESFSDEIAAAGLKMTHQECRWSEIWAEVTPSNIDV